MIILTEAYEYKGRTWTAAELRGPGLHSLKTLSNGDVEIWSKLSDPPKKIGVAKKVKVPKNKSSGMHIPTNRPNGR